MSIITVASTKGGVGKSTLTFNLATFLLNNGKKVAILDADAQGTLTKCSKVREYMMEQGDELKPLFVAGVSSEALFEIANDKKQQGYIVFVDSPGTDDMNMRSSLLRSDMILTPCSTSAVELWEVETLMAKLKKLRSIQGRKIPLMILFNRLSSRYAASSVQEATQFFDQNDIYPDYILKNIVSERVSFKNALKFGKGVVEYTPKDEKAIQEIENCSNEILNIISNI